MKCFFRMNKKKFVLLLFINVLIIFLCYLQHLLGRKKFITPSKRPTKKKERTANLRSINVAFCEILIIVKHRDNEAFDERKKNEKHFLPRMEAFFYKKRMRK